MPAQLKVLFLSPEASPLAKTGGLADVAGALPAALKRLGADVRLVHPLYRTVREENFGMELLLNHLEVPLGNEKLAAVVLQANMPGGIPVYLIDREDMYNRPHLYGNATGDYYDNLERFAFFAHAALNAAQALSFKPDVIHCHDWQTGLVPALLKGPLKKTSTLAGTPTVFTIHNLGYQGLFPATKLPVTGLPEKEFYHPEGVEYWGKISLLKAGIVYADAITTVSPGYAREIQTSEYGLGMEGLLQYRKDVLYGILNGVDYGYWNPARDRYLPIRYTHARLSGKQRCKEALIQELNLDASLRQKPLMGMITRLDIQKGFDLLIQILDEILALDVGLVILGSGNAAIQKALQAAADRNPATLRLRVDFDEPLAHRIMAGVDIFLIPSRYEPCGLTQMYALKYGTVPVVRATGGLDDTIIPFDKETGEGNGFKFGPYETGAFLAAIRQAVDLFHRDPQAWKRLKANGMQADFSWDRSAKGYMKIYQTIMQAKSAKGYRHKKAEVDPTS
jgi:starch synthase